MLPNVTERRFWYRVWINGQAGYQFRVEATNDLEAVDIAIPRPGPAFTVLCWCVLEDRDRRHAELVELSHSEICYSNLRTRVLH